MAEFRDNQPEPIREPGDGSPYEGVSDAESAALQVPEDHAAAEARPAPAGDVDGLPPGVGDGRNVPPAEDADDVTAAQAAVGEGSEPAAEAADDSEASVQTRQDELADRFYAFLDGQDEGDLSGIRDAIRQQRAGRVQDQAAEDEHEAEVHDAVAEVARTVAEAPEASMAEEATEEDAPSGSEQTQRTRAQALSDTLGLIGAQPDASFAEDTEATAEAFANMVEVLGKADSEFKRESDDAAMQSMLERASSGEGGGDDKAQSGAEAAFAELVGDSRTVLERIASNHPELSHELVRAYTVEGEQLGREESREELDGLLAEDPDLIEVAVRTCESLGLSPKRLIDAHAPDDEDGWQIWVDHYGRLNDAGEDVAGPLQAKIAELLTPEDEGGFSAQFVCDATVQALVASDDPVQRQLLIERFEQAKREVDISPDNFDNTVNVAMEALYDADEETLSRLGHLVNESADELQRDLINESDTDDLVRTQAELATGRAKWEAALAAHESKPAQAIVDSVRAAEERQDEARLVDRNVVFTAAAEEYARRGDFANVQQLISQMIPRLQEDAYVKFWGMAETPDQMRELDPGGSEWVSVFNPEFKERYVTAQALVSGDTSKLADAATNIAADLLVSGGFQDVDAPAAANTIIHWEQLEQILDKTEEIGGPQAARDLSRQLLTQFQTPVPVLTSGAQAEGKSQIMPFWHLQPLYERLAATGNRSDYEFARDTIFQRPESDAVKAQHLTRFASWLGLAA